MKRARRLRPNRLVYPIVGFLLLTAIGCSKKETTEAPVVTVETATAEKRTIQQIVTSEAILFPRDQAAITPKVSAPVKAFYVNRGSRVHRGELLALLENRDLAAAEVENKGTYEQAQAEYGIATSSTLPEAWQKAEFDLKTAKDAYEAEQKVYTARLNLYQQGALPRKEFDQTVVSLAQAKATYELAQKHVTALEAAGKKDQLKSATAQLTTAKGKYEGAAAQLSYTEIRSPIEGVVTERPLYAGETAPAGTPLLVVMDTSSIIARAHIPEREAALLKIGDPAILKTAGGGQMQGTVTLVSPALDPNSTTVETWVTADNREGLLRPGDTANVQIIARTVNDAIVVPVSALLRTPEGESVVMVVGDDGLAHQVSVESGIRNGDRVQITKGLAGGEKVITTGAYGLPDKTRVKLAGGGNAGAQPRPDKS